MDELQMRDFIMKNGVGCRFVSMTSRTVVKNIRAASPYKGVIKISRKRGLINKDYVEGVKANVAKLLGVDKEQVTYEAGEVWYKHLTTEDGKTLPLVVNKTKDDGKYYLQYFPTSAESVYQMPDGTPVAYEQLKNWFYESKSTFKPTVIAPNLANIKELRASGVIMQAEDLAEAQAALLVSEQE